MALINFACFEDNNLLEIGILGAPVVVTDAPRTGTYCLRIPAGAGQLSDGWSMSVGRSEFYFQYAVKRNNDHTPWGNYVVFQWRDASANVLGCFEWTVTPEVYKVYVGNKTTLIGTTSTFLSPSWVVVEGYIKIHDSEGRVVIKMNGIVEVDYTGDTKPGTATEVDTILHAGWYSIWAGQYVYFDDVVVHDTTGAACNSWPMGVKIRKVATPTANGYYSQWTPTGATYNYQCIDEIPPSMDDYIEGVTYNKDCYSFGDVPVEVNGIAAVAVRYYGQGGGNIKRLCRYNSTDYLSDPLTLPGTFNKVEDVMYEKPGGGSWDITTFNNCEFGAEQE